MKTSISFRIKSVIILIIIVSTQNHLLAQFKSPIEKAAIVYNEIPVPDGFDLSKLNPDSIFSIDIYKSERVIQLDSLKLRFGINTQNGVVVIKSKEFERSKNYIPNVDEPIFDVIEKMPVFSQGEEGLHEYLRRNLKYPDSAKKNKISGRIICRFQVLKTGRIGIVNIINGLSPEIDQEVIKVIKEMPIWIPGKQNGYKVNIWYAMPVYIGNDNEDNKKERTYVRVLPPVYPGGQAAIAEFIRTHVVFPQNVDQSKKNIKVVVEFIVNEDGRVENPEVKTKIQPEFANEAIRVINMLPRFKPGTRDGVPSSSKFATVVIFD